MFYQKEELKDYFKTRVDGEMINLISFGTQNCEDLLKKFYENLMNYSTETFVLHYYSINYISSVTGPNIETYELQTEKKYKRNVYYKPLVLLHSIKDISSENFIYLDLDVVLTKNFVSELLFKKIENSNTPMSPNHYWEYPFSFEGETKKIKGDDICKLKNIEKKGVYVQNCLIVYSRRHFDFLLDWFTFVNDESFYHLSTEDEELYNVALWIYGQENNLGYICVTDGTIDDISPISNDIFKSFKLFQIDNFEKSFFKDRNNYYKNYNSENVMIFHGIKK